MNDNPREVLTLWMTRVNSLAVDDLLALYDDGAVLLPTFSDCLLTDQAGLRGYFEELCSHGKVEVSLDESSVLEQSFSNGLHALSGIYSWRFDKSGQAHTFEARFTFVLNLSQKSPILHHHSSQLPHKP